MPRIRSLGYSIETGGKALAKLAPLLAKQGYSSYFILCDENTLQHCLPRLIAFCPELAEAHIIEIENGEASKSLEVCANIWQTLAENSADRNALLLNLGGGVVSDLGGFCASVYKRGIDFIHVPTSLLAMADASVGGKTGIDLNGLKNFIGTFAQPKAVFIDPFFLQSLPQRHINNGMAEVYKMALVADKALWKQLTGSTGKHSFEKLIGASVALKNSIVLKDPYDKTLRKILNFGHTVGHALETLMLGSPQELLHGEAIYSGMLVESHLAFQKKLLSKAELQAIVLEILPCIDGIYRPLALEELLPLMQNDKKSSHGQMGFSLPGSIGTCRYDVAVSEKQLQKAFDFYNSLG